MMYGSTRERMSESVERSQFLIIFVSDKYYKRQSCQVEATYAHETKRLLIPLKIDKDYEPKGWLAFIVAAYNRVNFSGKLPFDEAFTELVEQIYRHRQQSRTPTPPLVPPPPASTRATHFSEHMFSRCRFSSSQQNHS
ncbi:unnamed protein product [Didymodactylos carnosus]|uniref:TIR domain-containing protein n=2 Tax=Didymodactylos carnosus TaxID=1234261 RepID=A0A8S2S5E8_9BILA|nr:unnamed protein product [Didymodactylos carnosus]CAF4203915.1 unnamed protein product [Didymodactylos carnosus]